MMGNSTDLNCLLCPRSIAIIGASKRPQSPGNVAIGNLLKQGYSGRIYPINPKYEEVLGIACFDDISRLPESVDCVLICLPSALAPVFLEKAGQAGARSAIVYASGFAETGEDGRALQNELKNLAKKYSMPVCGPNCIGLANFKNGFGGLSATVPPRLKPGRVSAVCQSGSVGIALLNNGRGIEYHYMVTSGNEAVVTAEDYIEFFLHDEETA